MLHTRIRPLPRPRNTPLPSAPAPKFDDNDNERNESDEAPEDLFTAFLPYLFPDDAPSFHGDPGQHLLYSSPRYGPLEIMVPSYPTQGEDQPRSDSPTNQVEEGRKLFAHFIWSAAMVVAEGVENASDSNKSGAEMWKVDGENVLELGAGAALPSIICALANASSITITDHPSSPALSGAIAFNVNHNLRTHPSAKTAVTTQIHIQPHEWGILDSDPWAVRNKGAFTRVIAADCFWMPSQHENLVRTMRWFLAPHGKVWVVVGFHTGRAIVAGFFETAVRMGMRIETIYERDLNSGVEGGEEVTREWVEYREGEGPDNRRRWCVIALLGN